MTAEIFKNFPLSKTVLKAVLSSQQNWGDSKVPVILPASLHSESPLSPHPGAFPCCPVAPSEEDRPPLAEDHCICSDWCPALWLTFALSALCLSAEGVMLHVHIHAAGLTVLECSSSLATLPLYQTPAATCLSAVSLGSPLPGCGLARINTMWPFRLALLT